MTDHFYDTVAGKLGTISDGASVLTYCDGLYKATPGQVKRFGQVRWITVYWNWEKAGAIDFEQGNPCYSTPGALRAYVHGRAKAGKRARVYCNRSDAAKAARLTEGIPHEWWIATLDGHPWTREELAHDLQANHGVTIKAEHIWGCQNEGGVSAPYDKSILFGGAGNW